MEFTCSGCGLTCCGTPIGSTELCEDCVDNIHKEIIGVKNVETYRCIRCGEIFERFSLDEMYPCDYCGGELYTGEFYKDKVKVGNDMNFTEAIGKYNAITRDGGTTVYYKNSDGTIVRKVNGIGGGFQLNYDLLFSKGWEEYKEQKLIVPERVEYSHRYTHIGGDDNRVYMDSDCRYEEDANRLKTFNYFTDKELAQYVADKQLIDRVKLVLHQMNMFNPDILNKELLIDEYVRDNYKEVLHRIKDYEMRNVEKVANKTTK